MLKRTYETLRDLFIAGLVFILPLVVLIILIAKVFQFLTGFTSKIAGMVGLESVAGISGHTIVGAISIIILCILCGYMVRVSFFKRMRDWLDDKLQSNIPGYATYREMAMEKLDPKEKPLPYESAVWIEVDRMQQPGFLVERFSDGQLLIFVPRAGKIDEGTIYRLREDRVEFCRDIDMRALLNAIEQKGAGISTL
jgi:hypothetical protein